jgi:hypothetical protein
MSYEHRLLTLLPCYNNFVFYEDINLFKPKYLSIQYCLLSFVIVDDFIIVE